MFSFLLPQTYYVHAVVVALSDIAKPLTAEQIAELERDPQSMVNKCVSTLQESKGHSDTLMSWDKDQLALCDSFMSHLQNKCFDFSSLLEYCELDPYFVTPSVAGYDLQRKTQLNCLENSSYSTSCSEYFSNSSAISAASNFAATLPPMPGAASNATEAMTQAKNLLNMASSALPNSTEELINEAEKLINAANEETANKALK